MGIVNFVRLTSFVVACGVGLCFTAGPLKAQSVEAMVNTCTQAGQRHFRDFTASVDARYMGVRIAGAHLVNGRILLETRPENFTCTFTPNGRQMVLFFAEGRIHAGITPTVPPAPPPASGDVVQVRGVPANDVLNVRSGPGTAFGVVGALANGATVRQLRCQSVGTARWCEIEMQSDMRERGWVNARYLSSGSATNLPSPPAVQPSPPSAGGRPAQVTGLAPSGRVNIRSGPGTDFRIVGSLTNGAQVTRYDCRNRGSVRWCEILTPQGLAGWMSARYLSDQPGSAQQLPIASRIERVRFAPGTTGTELVQQLGPNATITYLLNARNGQNLYFRLASTNPNMTWQMFNPDGSLLDRGGPSKQYSGQLFRSGDYRVEVANSGTSPEAYNVIFGLE